MDAPSKNGRAGGLQHRRRRPRGKHRCRPPPPPPHWPIGGFALLCERPARSRSPVRTSSYQDPDTLLEPAISLDEGCAGRSTGTKTMAVGWQRLVERNTAPTMTRLPRLRCVSALRRTAWHPTSLLTCGLISLVWNSATVRCASDCSPVAWPRRFARPEKARDVSSRRLGVASQSVRRCRGFFLESYHRARFIELGISNQFVQHNHSRSRRGTLRGFHSQLRHSQAKLRRVVESETLDIAVDIRLGSPHFGKSAVVVLSAQKQNQIYTPPGFAHGFLAVTDSVQFLYQCSEFYDSTDELGIAWNDPNLAIPWGSLIHSSPKETANSPYWQPYQANSWQNA